MAAIDSIIRITISQATTPVAATSTTIPLLVADAVPSEWEADDVVRTFGGIDELVSAGFEADSAVVTYATLLLSQSVKPPVFLVGKKAASALAAADLDAIEAQDGSFYGIILVKGTDAEIETCAEWTEARKKLFFAASASAAIGDEDDKTNIAATLRSKSYRRTALIFSPGSADKGIEAAWVGGQLPQLPGSNNWAAQTLAGIAADPISTASSRAIIGSPVDEIQGNGANIYRTVARRGQTQMGTVSSGEFIDNIIGEDWLYFNWQASVFSVLGSGRKVPYTDKGVGLLEAQVFAVMQQGEANGLIAAGYTTTADSVVNVPATQRAARKSPTIYAACRLTGAINAVEIRADISL